MKSRIWFLIQNFCFLLSVAAVSAGEAPVRILPLGDSLSAGIPVEGGYRTRLYSTLSADGFTVDFIGTQTVFSNHPQLPDPDHEGHGGFQIHEIDAGVEGWISSVEDPDVVLLWIGTNDYSVNNDINNARNRLANLIAHIATLRPHAKIIVANLLIRTDSPTADQNIQTTFNPYLPAIVDEQVQLGRQVSFVDLRSTCTAADLIDSLHPNLEGYNKIADAWRLAIRDVITPAGTTNPPAIARIKGQVNRRNVSITFSKPVEDPAAAVGNFTVSGGVSVLAAELDAATKRTITLTTTAQLQDTVYTVTVNGVRDRTPARNVIAANSQASFRSGNVAEAVNFDLVYSLPVSKQSDFNINGVPYQIDKHLGLGAFDRVAYYLELESAAGRQYAWVSMDALTTDAGRIGVPAVQTGAFFQQAAANMNVQSTVTGLNGTGLAGGRLEFWSGNYGTANAAGVPGASDATYDFGDSAAPGEAGYGSMQIHNSTSGQTILAYNGWGGGGLVSDLGIGSSSGQHPDWTLAQNAKAYTNRLIQVYVRPGGGSPGAPVITVQPESLTVSPGGAAGFSVAATGGTLSYQWRFNGAPISGATSTTYSISNVQAQHAGNYDVVVSNASGSVTSSVAVLTMPLVEILANGSFEAGFSGWAAGGNVIAVAGYAPVDGTAVLAFNSGQSPPNGMVSQIFSTTPGTEYSLSFAAGVLAFNTSEQRLEVTLQGATTLLSKTLSMIGDGSGTTKWKTYTFSFVADSALTRLTFRDVSPTSFSLDMTLDKVQITRPAAPLITAQPVNQSVLAGEGASFSVTAAGQAPLSYQWRFNGNPISGATSSTLNIANVQSSHAGNYDVVVSNAVGSVASSVAVLTVLQPGDFANGSFESGLASWTATGNVAVLSGSAPYVATDGQFIAAFNMGQAAPNGVLSQTVNSAPGQNGTLSFDFGVLAYNRSEQRIRVTVQGAGTLVQQTISVFGAGNGTVQWVSRNYPFVSDSGALTIRFEDLSPTSLNLDGLLDNVRLTLQGSPVITTQPSSQTVTVGGAASFSVTATGAAPLSYQWQLNGSPISGATSSTLTLNNVQVSNAGNYTVVVSNAAGSVTSAIAVLTVNQAQEPPVITTQPASLAVAVGGTAAFSVTATGTAPLTYQWRKNGSPIAGATSSTYTINSVQTGDAGGYTVVVTNGAGSVTSSVATLTIPEAPVITTQPASLAVAVGGTAAFSVTATGTAPLTYQWRKNGSPIAGATSSTFTINSVQTGDAGGYTVVVTNGAGSVTSSVATLTIPEAPVITTQPASLAVAVGGTAAFSVTATGTAPLTYQWRKNGSPIAGATSSTYTINSVQTGDAGGYTVVVTNGAGSVTSSVATLTIPEAPVITTQPASLAVAVGGTAAFSVTATGTAPLTYQWRKNGSPIAGATSSTFTINSVQTGDAGGYTVVVTNGAGSVTSSVATLTIQEAPVITTQPASLAVAVGGTAAFSVTATGTAPLTYQWRKNGSPIAGATSSTFTINSVQTGDAGDYTVVVTNGAGSVTSSVATLTVTVGGGGLVNGSFESGLTGWTASGNVGAFTGTFYGPRDGSSVAAFNSGQSTPNGVISQTISTTSGQSYTLIFDFGVLAYNFNEQRIRVTVQGAGTLVNQTVANTGSGNGVTRWISRSFPFVADSTSITVSFQDVSLSTINLDAVLDKVALTTQSTPAITTQPLSQTIAVGDPVTFSVTATGQLPLAYQWRFNGGPISGANSDRYTISAVQGGDAGGYDVVVSNGSGSVTSSVAVLTVVQPSNLKNGSFEAELTDWVVSGNVQADGAYYGPTDGLRTAVFNAGQSTPNGVLSQMVATTPGQAYTLTFDVGVLAFNFNAQQIQVTVQGNSTLVNSTISLSGDGTGKTKWTSRSFSFNADSSAAVVTFRDTSPATLNLDLTLDRVQFVAQGGGAGLLSLTSGSTPRLQQSGDGAAVTSITRSQAGWTITGFASRRGTYQLERSEDLDFWTVLGQTSAAGGGVLKFDDQDAPGMKAFYRIIPADNGQAAE
ncbi:MAG: immunoglobulin domain-containing protein [Verrucomicrobiia bacterium]